MREAILALLERAALCLDRGQPNMAQAAFMEADKRYQAADMDFDEAIEAKLEELEQQLDSYEFPEESVPQESNIKCPACKATGKFGTNGLRCIPCRGKGFMTPKEQEYHKQYWERREQRAAATRRQPAPF